MKKQKVFDLASMPKMVLIVALVVMLGTLFGATSYLLKAPKTDLPIVNPIIETQCEIDSDCELVYAGSNICLPCDTSIEEYECFPLKEAEKIEEERFKRMVNDNIFCERCLEKSQHACKCENGKCEKVKEKLVEEVIITTDKTEYEIGEEVKITIENNSDKEQKIGYPDYFIERFKNDNWVEVRQVRCPCGALCDMVGYSFIKPKDKLEFEWDQQESWCSSGSGDWSLSEEISNQVQSGKYRIRSIKVDLNNADDKQTIYSNESTIKEKSALDPMCNEIVKIIGNCDVEVQGYHFDLDTEECAAVNSSGCSIKSPFETLEECQEVCEKSKIDSRDILSDEKVYEILKNFAVRPNAANISDDNILLDAIESQNGDIKKRLKKVEHDLNEIGIGDAIDWRGYVNATTKVCIARSIIYNNLKHTCDLKHDSLLSLEDVDDLLATEEIIPYFLVGFTYFKSGDYAKANYYLDQIILHRQAEIDRWGESYFINTSGEVYEKIYKKTMQVLNEIEIAANS